MTYFDALTTAAVADECQVLCGGRIQEVVQIDDLEVGFEVYANQQRYYLVASAHAQRARVHLCSAKLRRGAEVPSPLLLLLRKYARGGRIAAVQNPPFERILQIKIQSVGGTYTLVIEPMGKHANIILVNAAGIIVDAIKRVGPQISRIRPVLPGKSYVPPPPQAKLDPPDLTQECLDDFVQDAEPAQPVWRVLVSSLRGTSPLLAKEIVHRALGSQNVLTNEIINTVPLFSTFCDMLQQTKLHRWKPSIALRDGFVVAFAPYQLTQYDQWTEAHSTSAAIEHYHGTTTNLDAYVPAKNRVRAILDQAHERANSRHKALERQLVSQQEMEKWRTDGEMILAYAHTITKGQSELEAQIDFDSPPLKIALDPHLSAVENAQACFAKYEKAKSAAADIPRLLKQTKLEMAYLDQLATDLDLASNHPEIQEVKSALAEAGYISEKRKTQRGQPLRIVSREGMTILVGKSARQNDEITFRRSAPDDLWLHAVDVPGSHVIVKSGGRTVSEETLRQAAALAAYYSAQRQENRVLVAYTPRKYVRRIQNTRPGMVTYRHEQTIRVSPAK
ncbi:MAG: NFACT family protein [Anaerolineae bacterium]|nr:NFACT family protein [Anaerolineae bacterium]